MYRNLTLVALLITIPGCEVIDLGLDLIREARESGSAKLVRFESEEELRSYFRSEVDRRDGLEFAFDVPLAGAPADGIATDLDDSAPTPPPSAELGDANLSAEEAGRDEAFYSGTTLQERGVDEADVVKTDGERLYIISQGRLSIVRIVPSTELVLESEYQLTGYGREMYVDGDTVIAISETYGRLFYDDVFIDEVAALVDEDGDTGGGGDDVASDLVIAPEPSNPATIVTILDVSDPTSPVRISQTTYDGNLSASRKIEGMLYLVLANYQTYYAPFIGLAESRSAEVDLAAMLPSYEHIDEVGIVSSGDLVTWQDMYRPTDGDGYGVLTIVSVNVDNDGTFDAVGVVAEPGLIYASANAMYLTDTDYNGFGDLRETSDIYKFSYTSGKAEPVATGSVPGRILNQYSMGEHNGFLRVATTVRPGGFAGAPHNDVYVLEQQADELVVAGSVEGIAPRETIQSARFVGDRGFVVTFETIDPLFTLDMSDPFNPTILGELKVPGFSTYLVPMDENHLLSVGQYIPDESDFFRPWGVQMTIFDVTNFNTPIVAHNVVIGGESGAYSEALYNPKAFNYFAERGRIALPVSIYEDFPFFFEDDVIGVAVDPVAGDGGSEGDRPDDGIVDVEDEKDESDSTPPAAEDPERPDETPSAPPVDIDEPAPIDEPYIPGGFDGVFVYDVSTDGGFVETSRISTRFEDAGYYGGSFTRGVFVGPDVFAVTDVGIRGLNENADEANTFELFLGSPFAPIGIPSEPFPAPAIEELESR